MMGQGLYDWMRIGMGFETMGLSNKHAITAVSQSGCEFPLPQEKEVPTSLYSFYQKQILRESERTEEKDEIHRSAAALPVGIYTETNKRYIIMADEVSNGGGTSISITALDGIVNVNSLFTLASFVGLAWNPSDGATTLSSPECAAGDRAESDLVTFHVLAFGCFLFSSLVALCLKQAIRTVRRHSHGHGHGPVSSARINRFGLRAGILTCATGSVFACIFLMLALINVVQVRLGRISCGGVALGAVVPLVIFVPAGLFIYAGIVLYAFARTH